MFRELLIQIAGKTYTPDNIHEIHDDPNITPAGDRVTNEVHGDVRLG